MFWAGDSRAYVLTPSGVAQLSTDDLRDPGDAMANLRHDSVVSNAMSADTDFHVSYRRVELRGAVPAGLRDRRLLRLRADADALRAPAAAQALAGARSTQAWSTAVQAEISAVTGDDAAMAVLGVGTDLEGFQALLAPRLAELEDDVHRTSRRAAADRRGGGTRAAGRPGSATRTRRPALWAQYQVGLRAAPPAGPATSPDDEASLDEDAALGRRRRSTVDAVDDEPTDVAESRGRGRTEREAEPEPARRR